MSSRSLTVSRRTFLTGIALGSGAVLLPTGCATAPRGELPNFTLPDVNRNSMTYMQNVSVMAQRGSVSAWYFGHST